MNLIKTPAEYKDQSVTHCVFCNPDPSLLLSSTTHFTLLYDPFAVLPGHLILTSKAHFGCFGEVPEHLLLEYQSLRDEGIRILKNCFHSPITRYEHGRAGHCLSADPTERCCHHFHEHILPATLDMLAELKSEFIAYPAKDDISIAQLYSRYGEYLFIEESCGKKWFFPVQNKVPKKHPLRTLAAQSLGFIGREDWTVYRDCGLMEQGRRQIENTLHCTSAA